MRKVKAGGVYIYNPAFYDRIDARTTLKQGDEVRVVNLPGCPKANTMGHAHVEHPETGHFIGLVQTASLDTPEQYLEYLKLKLAKQAGA